MSEIDERQALIQEGDYVEYPSWRTTGEVIVLLGPVEIHCDPNGVSVSVIVVPARFAGSVVQVALQMQHVRAIYRNMQEIARFCGEAPKAYRHKSGVSSFYFHPACKPDKPDLVELSIWEIGIRTMCSACHQPIHDERT